MLCPAATKSLSLPGTRSMIGRPSLVIGRAPTHSRVIRQAHLERNGLAAATIASTRRWLKRLGSGSNSMVPARRTPSSMGTTAMYASSSDDVRHLDARRHREAVALPGAMGTSIPTSRSTSRVPTPAVTTT